MSETLTSGLTITIPSEDETGWADTIRDDCFEVISAHDHTGSGNGLQIGTNAIATSAVTTAKINDSAVTTAKINDLAVTTAKINDAAVTSAKIGTASVSYSGSITSGASGSMTWTSLTITRATYLKMGPIVFMDLAVLGTTGGVASTDLTLSLPYSAKADGNPQQFPITIRDNSVYITGFALISSAGTTLTIRKESTANWTLAASTGIWSRFNYETDQ